MKSKLLVVVDMQNDFITGTLGTPEARKIVSSVKAKIGEYMRMEAPHRIMFTCDTHGTAEQYAKTTEGIHLPIHHCECGTEGHEIHSELWSAAKEDATKPFKLFKRTFGVEAWGTEIACLSTCEGEGEFYPSNLECIELVGVCTDICIVTNVALLKTAFPDVHLKVDASCCAGSTPEAHQAALTVLRSMQVEVVNA